MAWDYLEPHFITVISLSRRILGCVDEDLLPLISPVWKGHSGLDHLRNPNNELAGRNSIISTSGPRQRPVFTFSQGVVGPLYTAAVQCRSPGIRREAIVLLLRYPQRDGIWDSFTARRLAWEIMNMEEEMCRHRLHEQDESFQVEAASDIPAHCRVRDVEVSWTDPCSARVCFRTVEQCERGEQGNTVKIVD